MDTPRLDPAIARFYAERYDEDTRLGRTAHGRLELLRTRELLARLLPPPAARVLDVGGGTGGHARWLAAQGYSVHVVDPVPRHVAAAEGEPWTAALGDARGLREADASVDAVLLLGPLYHMVLPPDRTQALAEAVRVARPGGVVVAAAISRHAPLLDWGTSGGLVDVDGAALPAAAVAEAALATGVLPDDPEGFTTAYVHGVAELAAERVAAGLRDVVVLGVEGPGAWALDRVPLVEVDGLLASALHLARAVESDPDVVATSPHLLGIGVVPPAQGAGR